MDENSRDVVREIDIVKIRVINPRVRTRKSFRELRDSIEKLGLKRPITVTRRSGKDGFEFDLVCGQGRIEACQSLGYLTIPAIVRELSVQDCLLQSLVENCARRKRDPLEYLQNVEVLVERGYKVAHIATKTGLSPKYVSGVVGLLEKGERRLVRAVEGGRIPISVAVEIAEADDAELQTALMKAYESKELNGRQLVNAKQVIAQRTRGGKGYASDLGRKSTRTANAVYKAFRDDVDRKRLMIGKANTAAEALLFVAQAMRTLIAEEEFLALLKDEGLDEIPRNLANRIKPEKVA